MKIFSTFGNPNFFGKFSRHLNSHHLALMLKRNPATASRRHDIAVCSLMVAVFLWHAENFMGMVHLTYLVFDRLHLGNWLAFRFMR
jgi:hypothetical protein